MGSQAQRDTWPPQEAGPVGSLFCTSVSHGVITGSALPNSTYSVDGLLVGKQDGANWTWVFQTGIGEVKAVEFRGSS